METGERKEEGGGVSERGVLRTKHEVNFTFISTCTLSHAQPRTVRNQSCACVRVAMVYIQETSEGC